MRRSLRRAELAALRVGAVARPSKALCSLLAAGAVCAALPGLSATAARAELGPSTPIGSEGTGDGQFLGPRGIGVDQTTLGPTSGDIYVADSGNARVEQLDSAGNFLSAWGWGVSDGANALEVCTSGCRAGLSGAGAGQLSDPISIAVDDSSGLSQGDVYVGDNGNKVVDKFSSSGALLATITGPSAGATFSAIAGVAVDASGNLWVADQSANVVYELDSSGTLLSQFADNYGETKAITVDEQGNVFLIRGAGEAEKWSAAARAGGSPVEVDSKPGTGLAVDQSTGSLYVDLGTSIDQWEASGKSLGNFGSGYLREGAQMAYNPNVTLPGAAGPGALYAADQGASQVAVFVPPAPAAPAVQPGSENATGVTAKAATINASVNADGFDTHVYFEYGPTAAYGTSTPAPPGTDIGSNFAPVATSANLTGLSASTTYHFRVVAANALGTTDGPDMTFTTATPTAPTVSSETTANVGSTKATLQASINPNFADTHYIFEYGPTTAYGTQIPVPPGGDVGESDSEQQVSVAIAGLQPQTTYHFRVVATNAIGSTEGTDTTFTTTAPLKIDAVYATNATTTSVDLGAKINPEGLSAHYHFEYGTTTSYGVDVPLPDGPINAAEGDQGVAVHLEGLLPSTKYYYRVVVTDAFGPQIGNSQSFTTYATGEPNILVDDRAYELVSPTDKNGGDIGGGALGSFLPSLQSGWGHSAASGAAIVYASFTSFGGAQSAGVINQYLSSRGSSGWTTQAISPPMTKHTEPSLQPRYRFFTAELTAGLLSWNAGALAPGAPEGEFENLYVRQMNAPSYELVTLAPPNQTSGYEATFAGGSADLRHVVFDARVALVTGAQANASNVYEWFAGNLRLVSVLPGPGSVAANSAGAGAGESGESLQENAVSADGSRIFWTDGDKQLYVREGGTTTVKLNTSQRNPSLGDGSALFRAATPSGSRVFFTDSTALTSAPDDNGGLYEYDLNTGALRDLSPDGGGPPEVQGVAGIGEDGLSVYFVARAGLASGATAGGYNLYLSRDGAISFVADLSSEDSRVWGQSPESRTARVTPDGEHIAFVSQAPLTGYDNIDANSGSADTEVFVYDAASERLSCASCNPSGVQPIGPATVSTGESIGYIPRFISDDGRRVFFDSKDALLPSAANGQQNVYEYENGAIHLISSGTSESFSAFVDASANGDDAFFITRSQLVREDTDNSSDVYDARVGGGFPAAVSPQPCAGESCRGALSEPPAPLGIGTEATSSAPETLPVQAPVVQAPKTGPNKRKAKRTGRKSKPRRGARRSKRRTGRHRGRGAHRTHHRGRTS